MMLECFAQVVECHSVGIITQLMKIVIKWCLQKWCSGVSRMRNSWNSTILPYLLQGPRNAIWLTPEHPPLMKIATEWRRQKWCSGVNNWQLHENRLFWNFFTKVVKYGSTGTRAPLMKIAIKWQLQKWCSGANQMPNSWKLLFFEKPWKWTYVVWLGGSCGVHRLPKRNAIC